MSQHVNWESLFQYGERRFYKAKEIIYRQGTYGGGFYYIHKGLIKVMTSTVKGRDRLLNFGFPGQTLGVQAIDHDAYATTAIAAIDSVLYFFPTDRIKELIYHHPELLHLITSTVNQNNRILIQNVYLDTMSATEKLSFVLLAYHEELKKINVSLTVQDLIKYTGLTRVTVQKVLKMWASKGLITLCGREVTVQQPEQLESYLTDGL